MNNENEERHINHLGAQLVEALRLPDDTSRIEIVITSAEFPIVKITRQLAPDHSDTDAIASAVTEYRLVPRDA